jgi:hypothetical protein
MQAVPSHATAQNEALDGLGGLLAPGISCAACETGRDSGLGEALQDDMTVCR